MNLTPVQNTRQEPIPDTMKEPESNVPAAVPCSGTKAYEVSLDGKTQKSEPIVYGKVDAKEQTAEESVDESMDAESDAKEASNLTGEDVAAMEEAGMTLEKYELTQLARAIERIQSQREWKQESANNYRERTREERESYDRMAQRNRIPSDVSEYVYDRLVAMDLPITEENLTQISQGLERAQQVSQLSKQGVAYLLRSDSELTFDNLYTAQYSVAAKSGTEDATSNLTTKVWDQMVASVTEVLQAAGVKNYEDELQVCRWMLDNDVSITPEHIKQYQAIENVKEQSVEDTVDCLILGISQGKSLEQTNLDIAPYQKAERVVAKAREQQAGGNATLHLQIQELRYRLTVQAAYRMELRGIEIDTLPIEEALDRLRTEQEKNLGQYLKSSGNAASAEEVSMCQDVEDAKASLYQAPLAFVSRMTQVQFSVTLEVAVSQGQATARQYALANEAYEQFGTEIRTDLGDSVKKAFATTDDLLRSQNIEVNDENRRAVRSLVYNQMEVTEEAVTQVAALDSSLRKVMEDLTPEMTLAMIRAKENPMNLTLTQLEEKIAQLETPLPEDEKNVESYSKYLWKMEHSDDITKEERSAYIGMYRLLHQIEQSDGAALGGIAKTGVPVTLSNLLSQLRSEKQVGNEWKIDDSFGALAEKVMNGESISDQLSAGFDDYYEEQASFYRGVYERGEEARQYLASQAIPVTLANMDAIEQGTLQGLNVYGKALRYPGFSEEEQENLSEQASQIVDSMEDVSSFREQMKRTDDYLRQLVTTHQNQAISYDSIKELQSLGRQLNVHQLLAERESYEIPVITGDKVTNMNVTLVHKANGKGKIHIEFAGDALGQVSADFTWQKEELSGLVMCEKRAGMDALRANNLERKLNTDGYAVTSLQYGIYGGTKTRYVGTNTAEDGETVDTKTLYKISKLLVTELARADKEEVYED